MIATLLATALVGATSAISAPVVSPAAPAPRVLTEYRAVAMMPLSSLGSTDEAVEAVSRVLHGELSKLLGERLITAEALARRDAKLKSYLDRCEGVLDCLTEVFGAFGWQAFLAGNLAGLGDDRVITLKLIDARTGKEVRRASEKASGDERGLIKQMRKAAVGVLAPELFTGTLEVHAQQPGMQVIVDGQLVGTTPLANPRIEIAAGRHAIEANGEGLVSFSDMVEVGYGEVVPINVVLPENSVFVGGVTPFRARWWTWVIAAVGAGTAATGGYFYWDHVQTAKKMEQKTLDAVSGPKLDKRRRGSLQLSRELGGAGAAALLGVGVLLTMDLF